MSRKASVVLLLVAMFLDVSMPLREFPSYEDHLNFRFFPPHATQLNGSKVLLELKSVVNKIHDPDFLIREMAIPTNEMLQQTTRLYADNYNVSETCREHWNRTITGLTRSEFWAIKMLDAAGKIGPGILEGNTKWLGSYDECFRINRTFPGMPPSNSGFETHFCGLETKVTISYIPLDVGFAVCAPKACSPEDLKQLYNDLLKTLEKLLPIQNSFRINNAFCRSDPEIDTRAIVAIVILSLFAFLILAGTLYDVLVIQRTSHREQIKSEIMSDHTASQGEKTPLLISQDAKPAQKQESMLRKLLLSFSVYSNGKKILLVKQSAGALTALNGIRFLSISWVVLGHTFAFVFTNMSNGLVVIPDLLKRWTFQAVANALVSVDSFFALSGLLLAYLTLKEMKKGEGKLRINWFMFYFHRFWRLTPVYMILVMISICLSRYFGDGPLFPENGFEENFCEDTWWKNLLYINNFFDKSCFGVSWYLANDMQFFVLSPLMLIPLYFYYPIGIVVCFMCLLGSAIAPGVISNVLDLPPTSTGGGGSAQGRADYFQNYYVRPYCRMGPYIVGIIVGSLLYKTDCKVKINKFLNILLWLVFTTLALLVLYGLRDPVNFPEDALNRDVSALYNATHKIVWGACVCWVIFACATGNGGFINTLLSWSAFVPLARLSYCIYLTHYLVIATYYSSQRSQIYLDDFNVIYLFLGHLVLSTMTAFVASLSFEAPMMGLEKVIFKRDRRN